MGEIGKLRHKPTKLKIKLKSSHSKEYSNLELLGEGQSQLHNQSTFFPLALLRLLFSCPVVSDSETSWTAAHQAFLSISISQSLLKLLSIESTMSSKHLFLCHPLLLPSIFPSIRVFTNESALHIRWPEHWSFSISPSNEYSGLISFLSKGLSRVFSNTTVQKRQFFGTQPFLLASCHTHPYLTTEKTISLTIQTFVGKVMSLLFNTLSRFVMAFLPRSNRLLISWLQSPSTVLLEPKKRKSVTASTSSLSVCHEVMGLMPWSQFF